MKKYIGTKIVKAEPSIRVDGKICHPGTMLSLCPQAEQGFTVLYSDGYLSWSPKEVFEEAYRETDGMPFGLAIEAIKKGKKVARRGWNGKEQYIELAVNISYLNSKWEQVNAEHKDSGSAAIAFVGTRGVQLGWLASQSDMLSDDWYIVEE